MQKNDVALFFAECQKNNSLEDFLSHCTKKVIYVSGKKTERGKENVYSLLKSVRNANERDKVANYYYSATVKESSVSYVKKGDKITAVAQFDKFNCTGFFTFEVSLLGKIKAINFHTDSGVSFNCDSNEKWSISKVPANAHDAIGYRAFAFGIMDENVILSKHIQRYDVFQDMLQEIYQYIMRYVVNDFNKQITNIAGYMYVVAMAEAINRVRNNEIRIDFSPKQAAEGVIPEVDPKYQKWINEGYQTGKDLFLGFIEYVNLRHPKENVFSEQLMQSFMDMCLYGSTQANKEMDMGRI